MANHTAIGANRHTIGVAASFDCVAIGLTVSGKRLATATFPVVMDPLISFGDTLPAQPPATGRFSRPRYTARTPVFHTLVLISPTTRAALKVIMISPHSWLRLPFSAFFLCLATAQEGLIGSYGSSCGGLTLTEAGIPRLDHSVNLNLEGAASSAATLFFLGLSAAAIDLSPIGAPGCTQLLANPRLDAIVIANAGGLSSRLLPIPINAALIGVRVRCQALAIDASANALGGTTSQGMEVTIGGFGSGMTITSAPQRGQSGQIVFIQGAFGVQDPFDLCVVAEDASGRVVPFQVLSINGPPNAQTIRAVVGRVPPGFSGGPIKFWRGWGTMVGVPQSPTAYLGAPQTYWFWNGQSRVGDTAQTGQVFQGLNTSACARGSVSYDAGTNEIVITLPPSPCPLYARCTTITIDAHWDYSDGSHDDFLMEGVPVLQGPIGCDVVAQELAQRHLARIQQNLNGQTRFRWTAGCEIRGRATTRGVSITRAGGEVWVCCPGAESGTNKQLQFQAIPASCFGTFTAFPFVDYLVWSGTLQTAGDCAVTGDTTFDNSLFPTQLGFTTLPSGPTCRGQTYPYCCYVANQTALNLRRGVWLFTAKLYHGAVSGTPYWQWSCLRNTDEPVLINMQTGCVNQ